MAKRMTRIAALLLSVLLLIGVCTGCSLFGTPAVKLDIEKMPAFTTQDLNGETVDERIFAEHDYTLIYVWTTIATPAVDKLAEMEPLRELLAGYDIGLIGIVTDTPAEQAFARDLVKKNGLTFPNLCVSEELSEGFLAYFNVLPCAFIVDQQGSFVGTPIAGAYRYEDFAAQINTALAGVEGVPVIEVPQQ